MHGSVVQNARDMATPYSLNLTAHDTSGQMVVQHVPALGTGAAAATCAVTTATDLTFLIDAGVPAGADVIGTAGVILFSGYATMGALADYINSFQAWRAYLTGALRADASASKLLTAGAASCYGDNGLTILGDTSSQEHLDVTFSGEKFINNGIGGHIKDWDSQCENKIIRFSVTLDMASAGTLTLYSGKQGSTETSIYSQALADDTELEKGYDLPVGSFFKAAKRGERLILRAAHATDIGSAVAKYETAGMTAVLSGAHVITEGNCP